MKLLAYSPGGDAGGKNKDNRTEVFQKLEPRRVDSLDRGQFAIGLGKQMCGF